MLFFTSSRPGRNPEASLKDAGTALRHAGEDIADAARLIGEDASRQIRANAATARAEAEHQVRTNAAAVRDEAKRQIRRNTKALKANASVVPDELLPAGREAVRKSVERLVPGRKKQSRRGPLVRVLAVLAVTGLALLGVQMLMTRRSSSPARRKGWDRSPEGSTAAATSTTGIADPLGMAGTVRPLAEVPTEATFEPASFDRDAGIRAATEGMQAPDPDGAGSQTPPSEIADGM